MLGKGCWTGWVPEKIRPVVLCWSQTDIFEITLPSLTWSLSFREAHNFSVPPVAVVSKERTKKPQAPLGKGLAHLDATLGSGVWKSNGWHVKNGRAGQINKGVVLPSCPTCGLVRGIQLAIACPCLIWSDEVRSWNLCWCWFHLKERFWVTQTSFQAFLQTREH